MKTKLFCLFVFVAATLFFGCTSVTTNVNCGGTLDSKSKQEVSGQTDVATEASVPAAALGGL